MKILVTGAAGFIGFHLIEQLVKLNYDVVGIDNINDYYDVNLKYDRLSQSGIIKNNILSDYKLTQSIKYLNYRFSKIDISDLESLVDLFEKEKFSHVINLAAQAGVRYSLINPHVYIQTNIAGFVNILECCKNNQIEHFIYASSSSVYGANSEIPFSENDRVDTPVSLYAATKKSNELIAYTYSHLYNLPTTGLRFFTVYGPWGRPDMAPMLFAEAIINKVPIKIFNNGEMQRDFTYVDDIISGIIGCLNIKTNKIPDATVYNIGNSNPIDLMEFISVMENKFQMQALKEFHPMQLGDVARTWADTTALFELTNYKPSINLDEGLSKFSEWFLKYKNQNE
jgi:UDP-glucuronate 4-epimerase